MIWTGGLLATKSKLSGAGVSQIRKNQQRPEVLNKTLYIPCAFITHFGKCIWAEIWDILGQLSHLF